MPSSRGCNRRGRPDSSTSNMTLVRTKYKPVLNSTAWTRSYLILADLQGPSYTRYFQKSLSQVDLLFYRGCLNIKEKYSYLDKCSSTQEWQLDQSYQKTFKALEIKATGPIQESFRSVPSFLWGNQVCSDGKRIRESVTGVRLRLGHGDTWL